MFDIPFEDARAIKATRFWKLFVSCCWIESNRVESGIGICSKKRRTGNEEQKGNQNTILLVSPSSSSCFAHEHEHEQEEEEGSWCSREWTGPDTRRDGLDRRNDIQHQNSRPERERERESVSGKWSASRADSTAGHATRSRGFSRQRVISFELMPWWIKAKHQLLPPFFRLLLLLLLYLCIFIFYSVCVCAIFTTLYYYSIIPPLPKRRRRRRKHCALVLLLCNISSYRFGNKLFIGQEEEAKENKKNPWHCVGVVGRPILVSARWKWAGAGAVVALV